MAAAAIEGSLKLAEDPLNMRGVVAVITAGSLAVWSFQNIAARHVVKTSAVVLALSVVVAYGTWVTQQSAHRVSSSTSPPLGPTLAIRTATVGSQPVGVAVDSTD